MNVLLGTTWLASGGFFAADRIRINGVQIVDEATFFRAYAQTVFARGNVRTTLKFVTHWTFNDVASAELFALTLSNSLPFGQQLPAQITCADGVTQVYLNPAVLEDANVTEMVGCSVDVEYTLTGGVFTSTTPPDFPTAPGSATIDGQPLVYARGVISIPSGVSTITIAYGTTFSGASYPLATLSAPTGAPTISGQIDEDTITSTGFTYNLAAPTPDGTYKLRWWATS